MDKNGFNTLQHLFNYGGLTELKFHTCMPFQYLYKIYYKKNTLNCINLLSEAGIDINHTTKIDYQFSINGESFPIDISALTLALNNVPLPSKKIIKS